MDLSQSEDIDYRAYSMLPTAPLLDTCIVCKQALFTDTHSLPCKCLVPIHVDCITKWKHSGDPCPFCGEYAENRCTNAKWALYCLSVVTLLCFSLWFFFVYVVVRT